jgi:inorganic triphosphatase YgiF
MMASMVFKRYELKYLMNKAQKDAVNGALQEHMVLDKYGRSSIRNIYFDTDDFRIARRSIERPV